MCVCGGGGFGSFRSCPADVVISDSRFRLGRKSF